MAYPVPTANTASTMAPVRDLKNDLDCCGTFGAGTAGVVGATTLLDVRAGTAGAAATGWTPSGPTIWVPMGPPWSKPRIWTPSRRPASCLTRS
jgi:hypothetical protein